MSFKKRTVLIARFVLILSLLSATLGLDSSKQVSAASGDTTLISIGSIPSALGANNASYRASISADGRYVAFNTRASNLVSSDTNGKTDIFVFDRQTRLVERVSVASNGAQANGDSMVPSISADGRYVVFRSDASNLVDGDTNGGRDVFLHDRQTGVTERIAATASSVSSDSANTSPTVSADGRFVAFATESYNLIDGDTNGSDDMFVFDRQTQVMERVSVSSNGEQANYHSFSGVISADGKYVAFGSFASDLVDNDTNDAYDIFVHNRLTGTTERVSVDSSGIEANNSSGWASISADGRYVAFNSDATNLVSGDTNNQSDVFIHDRQTGITERVSVSSNRVEGNWNSYAPSISDDGRYVAFASYAGTLVSDDTNNAWDVFVHDRQTDTTERVSKSSSGVEGNGHSDWSAISGNGRYVAFDSAAGNLVDSDVNFGNDIFVHDRQTKQTELVSMGPVILGANQNSYDPSISADGHYISFVSAATNLVGDDTNHKSDVFVRDRQTGVTERVSVDSSGAQANDRSFAPVISADGRYVAFMSLGTNLVNDDTNAITDIFVHDRQTGVTERVSVSSSGAEANNTSQYPSISGDGRYVVFESYATNLASSDTFKANIFIRDRQTGVTERISTAPGGVPANRDSYTPVISTDGRYVAFRSIATNLVAGDTNGKSDIFLYDRLVRVIERISLGSGGVQANDHSEAPSISGDGRYVAFQSAASNLVSNDVNGMDDIFIHDRQTGITKPIWVDSSGMGMNIEIDSLSISGNGRYVVFTSDASNLVSNDTNTMSDVFVYDHLTGVMKRVSVDSSEGQANGSSGSPSISENGQFVAFSSVATNLVDGDNNYLSDVFLHENEILVNVEVSIHGSLSGTYPISTRTSTRQSFAGINNGPVKISSTSHTPILAAERVIYKVNGIPTSFSEMMALSASELDTTYWLPWYNNVDLDTQLRFANVTEQPATVMVTIGGVPQTPIHLAAGESTRKSFAAINNGPVKIESTQNIVAAARVIYRVNGVNTSFTEMMALPANQLDTTYWLPWYNNVDLDTQLRIANVTDNLATVQVTIGGVAMTPLNLAAGASTRVSYPGVNNGPVKIVSTQNIVAAERVIYKAAGGVNTSFSEMLALPNSQLDTTYWLPWYNNKDLDTQLRFANPTNSTATVHVLVGGQEMPNSPFTLAVGQSTRQSFPNLNNGAVQIVSNVPIVAAARVIYKVNAIPTSFSEMMGLPNNHLNTTYWLPWYNNVELDTQLRFGVP